MFCSKCGTSNSDDSTYCSSCGASLRQQAGSPAVGPTPPSPPSYYQMPPQRKSPIIAALLSFFLFGIGYLYLGTKKILGIPAVLFVIIVLIVYIALGAFTFGLLEFVVGILLAYDSYVKAKGERGILSAEPEYLYGKPMT